MLHHEVVVVNPDNSKTFFRCMNRVVSLFTKQHNKRFINDKDIIQNRGDAIDNLKKYHVSIRMVKKHAMRGYIDMEMSNKNTCQYEYLHEEMFKTIDGRGIYDVTLDKHLY